MKIFSNEVEKARQLERKIQLEETKKDTSKRRKTKRIPRQDQTIQTKQNF